MVLSGEDHQVVAEEDESDQEAGAEGIARRQGLGSATRLPGFVSSHGDEEVNQQSAD